jgi:hypothetical protein
VVPSELLHYQSGNHLKVPRISRHHRVSQVERGGSDQQVLEWYLGTLALLFAVDSPG